MSKTTKREKIPADDGDIEPTRIKGVFHPESHNQEADRRHKIKHQKLENN